LINYETIEIYENEAIFNPNNHANDNLLHTNVPKGKGIAK